MPSVPCSEQLSVKVTHFFIIMANNFQIWSTVVGCEGLVWGFSNLKWRNIFNE